MRRRVALNNFDKAPHNYTHWTFAGLWVLEPQAPRINVATPVAHLSYNNKKARVSRKVHIHYTITELNHTRWKNNAKDTTDTNVCDRYSKTAQKSSVLSARAYCRRIRWMSPVLIMDQGLIPKAALPKSTSGASEASGGVRLRSVSIRWSQKHIIAACLKFNEPQCTKTRNCRIAAYRKPLTVNGF